MPLSGDVSVVVICETELSSFRLCCIYTRCRLGICVPCQFNPLLPNGLFHPYQLDESISKFGDFIFN